MRVVHLFCCYCTNSTITAKFSKVLLTTGVNLSYSSSLSFAQVTISLDGEKYTLYNDQTKFVQLSPGSYTLRASGNYRYTETGSLQTAKCSPFSKTFEIKEGEQISINFIVSSVDLNPSKPGSGGAM